MAVVINKLIDLRDVIAEIASMNEQELIDIIYVILGDLQKKLNSNEFKYAFIKSYFDEKWGEPVHIEFLAIPGRLYWTNLNDGAYDTGVCPVCDILIACANKIAICPICGFNEVQCT